MDEVLRTKEGKCDVFILIFFYSDIFGKIKNGCKRL